MSILLKSGMVLNMKAGQVCLTQVMEETVTVDEKESQLKGLLDSTMKGAEDAATPEEAGDQTNAVTPEEGGDEADTVIPEEGGNEADMVTPEEGGDEADAVTPEEGGDESDTVTPEEGTGEGDITTPQEGEDLFLGNEKDIMGEMQGKQEVKDPIMSNWFFVGGISAATLVVSIVLGILLAKRRIKKGIELYED